MILLKRKTHFPQTPKRPMTEMHENHFTTAGYCPPNLISRVICIPSVVAVLFDGRNAVLLSRCSSESHTRIPTYVQYNPEGGCVHLGA